MEKVLMEAGQNPLNQDTCQKLARSFSRSAGRAGKPVVKWRQIQSWFQDKQQELGAKVPSLAIVPKESIDLPNALDSNNQPEGSFERPKGTLFTC
uniref:Protein SAWADEE HOMEODOMAIN HOMOLOG 1-like n=1 Tax=Nelumbo nucifera TaxID=4432 RepID=A0A822ZEI7_NELNU|nr:TPA_asm: hypothetical protein HUJ06_002844 [Nelumbo nucifera]